MNYPEILECILDIGEELLKCGAENFRIDDSLYRMCEAYGFTRYDVFVIPSNIQVTVKTPEGEYITQIRHIEQADIDYDKLDYFNNLSRYVCRNTPDADEIRDKFEEVMNRKPLGKAKKYIAGIMGGTGFAVFFGCNLKDAVVAVLASLLIVAIGEQLGKREHNVLVYNSILSFLAELLILGAYYAGGVDHPDRIMIGIVMLLISGLGVTNGIREIMQRDFISGFLNVTNAFLGALGIACGIAMAMIVLHDGAHEPFMLANGLVLQLISCTTACVGFAMWFNIKGVQIAWSGVGAFFTWLIYAVAYDNGMSNFVSTLLGAIFVAAFGIAMARINRAPSTIFITASAFPLIPGPNLYYLMYGFVKSNYAEVGNQTYLLFETCVAIAVGLLIVDTIARNTVYLKDENKQYEIRSNH